MTANDELDRRLAGWLDAESRVPSSAVGVERVLRATEVRRPRPIWLARLGSRWVGAAPSADGGAGTRVLPRLASRQRLVVTVFLLALAIAAVSAFAAGMTRPRPVFEVGGRMAYVLDGVVYLADADGGNPVRIGGSPTSDDRCDDAYNESRLWSPNGQRLAYRVGFGRRCESFVVIADADGDVLSTFRAGLGWSADWAPDSSRLATWGLVDGTIDIHGLDGVLQRQVTLPTDLCICGDWDPLWAPTSDSLIVGSWSVPLDDARPVRLITERDYDRDSHIPSISPNGTQMVFATPEGLFVSDLFQDVNDGRMILRSGELSRPLFSPTGESIAIFRSSPSNTGSDSRSNSADLLMVEVATGRQVLVTTLPGYGRPRAFSSEGDRIMFQHADAGGQSSLRSIQTDGTVSRELVVGAAYGDWQPLQR